RVGLILAGLAAGYLPWLLYLGRTVYQFYTIAFEPYLILALVFVISQLLGARGDPPYPRERGARLVAVFLALAVVISVFFWPLWTGMQVDFNFIRLHYWIDSWR
ncbi:MAG: phospholipid carrier-dependent glycosyltransferase, partial [Glaciihabitans sp.]|nr:phospholipid carrier-dependent glycosyltransferase [Glaciihabitans sp.]